jgi:hypothetical protein
MDGKAGKMTFFADDDRMLDNQGVGWLWIEPRHGHVWTGHKSGVCGYSWLFVALTDPDVVLAVQSSILAAFIQLLL